MFPSLVRTSLRTSVRFFSTARPFKILGVQQVAIGCEDRSALSKLWYDVFGLSPTTPGIKLEKENVIEDIVSVGKVPYEVEVDLMTPIDPEKSPKVHVPPLNHIGLVSVCSAYVW